jgi:arylsulfatase A-like enzyme
VRLNRLPRAAETIPEALARRGYRTFAVTENPNLSEQMGYDQGFSGFSNFPKSLVAEKITATLSEQRAQILGRQPYFLYVHYMDVHGPYRERPPFFDPTSEGDARQISAYDSGIFTVDDHIRRAWQAFGWDDALVVVLADHGEALGDRGQWGHGISLFAELLNIPMLVSLPGHNSARRLGDPVSLVDILPTLREVAGLPPAPTDEGVSLWPLLMGRANSLAPRPLYAHVWRGRAKGGRDHVLRGTLLRGWKRIGGGPEGALLFDLARDPMDQHNRAHDFPEIAAELQRRHLAFEAGCRKLAPEVNDVELDSEAVENLKALGYVQ